MKRLGKDLEFISQINRDGSGTTPMPPFAAAIWEQDLFEINCLSLTNGTYIASGFNSFVVRIKDTSEN